MNIADRIQQLRKSKGISQEQLADAIGVSRQAVSKWESEQSLPDLDKIILLSDYFEVTTDYLLKGIEPDKKTDTGRRVGNALRVLAPFMVWAGWISSAVLWSEYQSASALLNSFVWMAGGYVCIRVAVWNGLAEQDAMRRFWMICVWPIALCGMSAAYNIAVHGLWAAAPFPIPAYDWTLELGLFALVWLAVCVGVTVFLRTGNKDIS